MIEGDYNAGFQAGARWANRCTTDLDVRGMLINLEKLQKQYQGPEWEKWFERGEWVSSPAERLHGAMDPDVHGEEKAIQEFSRGTWGDVDPHALPSEFLRGFAEGALSVREKLGDEF